MSVEPNIMDIFKAYEEGKHRRYELLFAVNGGAFVIAKLFADPPEQSGILGNLTLWQLSLGMVLFTIIMVVDIFVFGIKMRKQLSTLFGWQGQLVLILIGFLIAVGWTLVSFGMLGLTLVMLGYLGSIVAVRLLTETGEKETEKLKQLNEDAFHAENKRQIGEKQEDWELFLRRSLADDFRISRASRKVQDKEEMIEQIRNDEREREGPINVSIAIEGDYGLVSSIVTVKGDSNKYHNTFSICTLQ
jgi:hypothetical protein